MSTWLEDVGDRGTSLDLKCYKNTNVLYKMTLVGLEPVFVCLFMLRAGS